jgi:hypothetical protein
MTVQIRLKRKYRTAHKGRYSGGEKPAPRKHRKKVGYDKHIKEHGVPPVIHLVVDGKTGAGVFVRVD